MTPAAALRYLRSHPVLPWCVAVFASLGAGLLAGCAMMAIH